MNRLLSAPLLTLSMTLPGLSGLSLHANAAESGNTIAVPVSSQSAEFRSTALLPERGQSMQSVKHRLGSPDATKTIGTPPITQWIYRNMTIYFEDRTVLRTVLHPQHPHLTP